MQVKFVWVESCLWVESRSSPHIPTSTYIPGAGSPDRFNLGFLTGTEVPRVHLCGTVGLPHSLENCRFCLKLEVRVIFIILIKGTLVIRKNGIETQNYYKSRSEILGSVQKNMFFCGKKTWKNYEVLKCEQLCKPFSKTKTKNSSVLHLRVLENSENT